MRKLGIGYVFLLQVLFLVLGTFLHEVTHAIQILLEGGKISSVGFDATGVYVAGNRPVSEPLAYCVTVLTWISCNYVLIRKLRK